ncbi:hypothetical protein D3C72_2311890 [compost metagenome]
MKQQHINPEEAIQIHRDLKAKLSIGVHWGTFRLSDEPMAKPPEDLKTALEKNQLTNKDFLIPTHGQILRLKH